MGLDLTAMYVPGRKTIVKMAIDFMEELSFLASMAIIRDASASPTLISLAR